MLIKKKCIKNKFGYCYYAFEKDSIGDYVHIYDLYVFPDYRRKGKARELLKSVIDAIRKTGYTDKIKIVAEPREDSIKKEDLISFYESLGLEVFTCYMK